MGNKIRKGDKEAIMSAVGAGVTPRRGIQFIQVGRKEETKALIDGIEKISEGNSFVRFLQATYGGGKALPLDTRIMTPDGWKPIGKIKKDDAVIDRNGKTTTVTGIFDNPQETIYILSLSDGRYVRCCGNHEWFVITQNEQEQEQEQVLTTEEISQLLRNKQDCYIPCCQEIPALKHFQGKDDFKITESLKTRKTFLSYLLKKENGYVNLAQENVTWKFTTSSYEIMKNVRNLAYSLGLTAYYTHYKGCMVNKEEYLNNLKDEFWVLHISNNKKTQITTIIKTNAKTDMRCISVADQSCSYIIEHYIPTHNTFLLTLSKTLALSKNVLVASADLSPDRRLYSTSGKSITLYRELMRNLSSPLHPDGGALPELLDAVKEQIDLINSDFLNDIRALPYGYDAVTVISKWIKATNDINGFEIKDACLRWFAGENTLEQKKLLGIKNTINDTGAYDALKMVAAIAKNVGYNGLLIEYDECVNLYKINQTDSRNRNYEQILRILNESLQGDIHNIGFIFAGTPEFILDPRRGLFSYDALKSRLIKSKFADDTNDNTSLIMELQPLPQESLYVLLKNLVNVQALGKPEDAKITDQDIELFLENCHNTLGSNYYLTPREILRDFVAILDRLEHDNTITAKEIIQENTNTNNNKPSSQNTNQQNIAKPMIAPNNDTTDKPFGF